MNIAILLTVPALALATPGAFDFAGLCQSKLQVIRSPEEVFKEHGIPDFSNACPVQSSIDDNKNCQESANSLRAMYKKLLAQRASVCNSASNAAAQAQNDCQGQSSCVAAQKAAVTAYQAALQEELKMLQQYVAEIDKVLEQSTAIADGGVKVLVDVTAGATAFPGGLNGGAQFVKGSNNRDALNRVYRNEDIATADAVVKNFLKAGALASDITQIKSDIIREPLQVTSAGNAWKQEVVAYQKTVESQSHSLDLQAVSLKNSGTNLGDFSGVSNAGGTSTIANAADAANNTAKVAPLVAALSGGTPTGVPQSAVPAAGASAPAGGKGTYYSSKVPLDSNTGRPIGAGPGDAPAASVVAQVPNAASPDSGSGHVATSGASSSFRATLAARLAARGSAARGPDAASGAGSRSPQAADAKATPSRDPANLAEGILADSADFKLSDAGSPFNPAPMAVASETNEYAVRGIVGAWEKALRPEAAGSSQDIQGSEGEPLFGRVRLAHERALRRGQLMRTIPTKR
jgi:hypothetical protein